MSYLEKSSEFNFPDAKRELGILYTKGEDVKKDLPKALTLLEQAVELGDNNAYLHLAHLYDLGEEGIKKDAKRVVELLTAAHELFCASSTIILAHKYMEGFGVEKDIKKAFELLKVTYEAGDPNSAAVISRMYFEGKGVKKNESKAQQILDFAKTKDCIAYCTSYAKAK